MKESKKYRVSRKFTMNELSKELDDDEIIFAEDDSKALNKYLAKTSDNYYAVNGKRIDDGTIPGYACFLYSIYQYEDAILEITMMLY